MHVHAVLVDEIVLDQSLHEYPAAEGDDRPVSPALQLAHGRPRAPASTWVPAQSRVVNVFVTTCLGAALRRAAIGLSSGSFGQCAAIFAKSLDRTMTL